MPVTPEERRSFGWLGKIPKEIYDAPREIVDRYLKLAKAARDVANMKNTPKKVVMAKDIESKYYALLAEARGRQ